MIYQPGDVVRIRDDLQVGSYYGLVPIKMCYDMREMCGKVGTVTDVNEEEYAVKVGDWWFSAAMLTPCTALTQVEQLTQIISDFRGFDLEKRLEEQLAEHLYDHGVRVMEVHA
ncbi:MAG: hypothetical protein IKN72_06230 [Clostridia bacterium]|nr:hypothetical protein [Clostridia bacterium]